MTKKMLEGSRAVAEMAALCRPRVVSAYPITPQTHIVQELAQMVADGDLEAEFVNVESEHSAASVLLGASATGVRTYTTTTSQGLLLMIEVLYNIAGLRLPIVMTCANRAVSSPLNIWNDQQDSLAARDSGWIQLYAENNQEAADLLPQAYRVAEDHRVLLPVMVCMDGFVLTHAYEAVDIPSQQEVDAFLSPYQPLYKLDPDFPLTMGAYTEPDKYTEARYMLQRAMDEALGKIEEVALEFEHSFGRRSGGILDSYFAEDASIVLVTMGSLASTLKVVVDELRAQGRKVGVLRLITYRPFPREAIRAALRRAEHVIVMEKALSPGAWGPLATDVRSAILGIPKPPVVSGVVAGLGGRDVTVASVKRLVDKVLSQPMEEEFLDLRADLELEGVS